MIRAKAMLWKPPTVKDPVHDGDTYWFIVDIKNNGFREGAFVCDVRLYGYSALEIGSASDGIRVSGKEAQAIAKSILTNTASIEIEFMGRDKYGRDLGKIYCDGVLLGEALEDRHAVVAGSFKGITVP